MKIFKKVLTVAISVLLWAIILLAALFAFTTLATRDVNQVSSIAGYTPLSVMSDSMSPAFKSGDLIIIRKCDTKDLQVGDIVCFHTIIENQYALNTHRIEKIEKVGEARSYTTKGDNNNMPDTHIIADGDIVGKYVGHLAGVGKVMDFLSSSVGFLLLIVLPMLLFCIYQLYHLIMVIIKMKKATAEEAALVAAKVQADALANASVPQEKTVHFSNEALNEAEKAKAEAAEALAEAKRMKAEAEAVLVAAKASQEQAQGIKER